jgi:hypothetical protein
MVRISVRTAAQTPDQAITVEGKNVPAAVRVAAVRLGVGDGRTIESERVGKQHWEWTWGVTAPGSEQERRVFLHVLVL